MAAQGCYIQSWSEAENGKTQDSQGKQGCELHLTEDMILLLLFSFLFTTTTPAELWIFPAPGQGNAETRIQTTLPRDST